MEKETVLGYREKLIAFAPEICEYSNVLKALNRRWSSAITAGMIETGRMDPSAAKLFGPLIKDMRHTKDLYGQTQAKLVDAILVEMSRKVVSQINDAAKFTINILKRNLFERTADVGYLATDGDIVDFLKQYDPSGNDDLIRNRLAQYQYEYTVYDDIIILDITGRACTSLTGHHKGHSAPRLVKQTLAIPKGAPDQYLETYGSCELFPGRDNALVYSQKISDPHSGTPLGVLCLSFDFQDEAQRIFTDLARGNPHIIPAILDEQGRVMASADPAMLPPGAPVAVDIRADFKLSLINGVSCFVSTVPTDGYQGFFGLTWYGMALIPTKKAFASTSQTGDANPIDSDMLKDLQQFSGDLAFLRRESNDLLGAMKIDSINGEVQAAKFMAHAFVKILHFVKEIGEDINSLFARAIENLQHTVATALFSEVEFRAFQGNNIADRNLYERANDVCWWALTPQFRQILSKADPSFEEKEALRHSLQYINDLYTPYLRLILADTTGEIIAVSDPPEGLEEKGSDQDMPKGQDFVGTRVDSGLLQAALKLSSSKDYCVSPFRKTPLYGGRPTYIYSTAVRHPENEHLPVGVIQIVFDSGPQFHAMLTDILPRTDDNGIVEDSFAVFADRGGQVISSTTKDFPPGSLLPFDPHLFRHNRGERDATIVRHQNRSYVLGLQVSDGYREYKLRDGYDNDVICMVAVPL